MVTEKIFTGKLGLFFPLFNFINKIGIITGRISLILFYNLSIFDCFQIIYQSFSFFAFCVNNYLCYCFVLFNYINLQKISSCIHQNIQTAHRWKIFRLNCISDLLCSEGLGRVIHNKYFSFHGTTFQPCHSCSHSIILRFCGPVMGDSDSTTIPSSPIKNF